MKGFDSVLMDDGSIPLQLLVVVLLILVNGFFASSEIALLSVNDAKMKKLAEKGDKKAIAVIKFTENSSKFLSTIQVGVTFSGFLSSAVAADSFAGRITLFLIKSFPVLGKYDDIISAASVIVMTLVLSFFTLVLGELVPKKLAMKKSDSMAMKSVGPLKVTAIIFAPFIKLVTISVNGVLRLVGINPNDEDEEVTEEEIMYIVNEGQEKGVIGDDEGEMINNILEFSDKTAADVMTHRTEICALPSDADYNKVMQTVINERYSRFPIYDSSIDNIIGIIHIKDLLRQDAETFSIQNILRTPSFVPESQKVDDVFKALKSNNTHITVVVDEYGGTSGIITMEDILEELVGNIRDEYDEEEQEEHEIQKVSDDTYIIDGLIEIDDLNDQLSIELPTDEYDTLSGFVIGFIGEIPEEDSHPEFEFENYKFTVEDSNEKIITKVRMQILPVKSFNNESDENDSEDEKEEKN